MCNAEEVESVYHLNVECEKYEMERQVYTTPKKYGWNSPDLDINFTLPINILDILTSSCVSIHILIAENCLVMISHSNLN